MIPTGRKRKVSSSSNELPLKKMKLAEGLLEDPKQFSNVGFESGQIVRISLTNWVTFDSTVMLCDPGLNLIVGPNGTGKSSVVCAICLGLGGKPRSLARGEKVTDFIKSGRTSAKIEIELFNKNKLQNDIIIRYITKKGSKWKLNNKNSSAKKIEYFVKNQRNIKVDNLCQFLPQDRVSEFARLSPVDLLIETEKAIEDTQLYRQHAFLMQMGEERDTSQNEIENLRQTIAQNTAEKVGLSKTVEQFQCKIKMEKQMVTYKALYKWTKAKINWKQYQRKKRETLTLQKKYEEKKGNIGPMTKEAKQCDNKLKNMKKKYNKHKQEITKTNKKRKNLLQNLETIKKCIVQYEDEITQIMQDYKERKSKIKKAENEIETLKQKLNDVNENDIEKAKAEKHKLTHVQLKNLRIEKQKIEKQCAQINIKKQKLKRNLDGIDKELDAMKNETKRKNDYIFKNKKKEYDFNKWVNANRSHGFEGNVFGPIVNEMIVRNELHAKYLNNCIGPSTYYGYVCTNKNDWAILVRKAKDMRLGISIYTMKDNNNNNINVRRPLNHELLHRNGLDGYLDEVFEAPQIIKKVLNDYMSLSKRAYSMNDINDNALQNVLVTRTGERNKLRLLMTPSSIYRVKDSYYSTNILTDMKPMRDFYKPILIKTPDLSQNIYEKEQKRKELYDELNNIQQESKQFEYEKKQIVAKMNRIGERKKELEDIINEFKKLKQKLNRRKTSLNKLMSKHNSENIQEIKRKLSLSIQQKNMERIKLFENVTNDIESVTNLMKQSYSYGINIKCFEEQRKNIQTKIKAMQKRNKILKKEFDLSEKEEKILYKKYEESIQSAQYNYPRKKYINLWNENDKKLNLEEIQSKINHFRGKIKVLFQQINPQRIERFQRLEIEIERQTKTLHTFQQEQTKRIDSIKDIENKWKPKLLDAVDKISLKFGEFFAQFNKAQGKVVLVCMNENTNEELKYNEWHIDILTKFRIKDVKWKRLTTASQSGGEKSVTTMLYLLSLQQVTTVPFRVVDEINQGMDPINERRIMQILNYECTPKDNLSNKLAQYFVVTPKLLPHLHYSPCSSVYVIFNGPYQMPQQYWKVNTFIQSQKELTFTNNDNDNQNEEEGESE